MKLSTKLWKKLPKWIAHTRKRFFTHSSSYIVMWGLVKNIHLSFYLDLSFTASLPQNGLTGTMYTPCTDTKKNQWVITTGCYTGFRNSQIRKIHPEIKWWLQQVSFQSNKVTFPLHVPILILFVLPTGVDDLIIKDGEHYLFWYKKLWRILLPAFALKRTKNSFLN